MSLLRLAFKTAAALLAMGLLGLASLFRPVLRAPAAGEPGESRPARARPLRVALGTAAGLLVLSLAGGAAFVYSGLYDIAASRPHLQLTETLLTTLKRRAVQFHARDLVAPDLDDADLIRRGLVLYRGNCVTCHGAPGEGRSRIGIGVNPTPPPLVKAIERWTAEEIAWITAYGLKMAGMPAFGFGEEPRDLWALTAFVKRMNTLAPAEYRRMAAAVRGEAEAGKETEAVPWLPGPQGWDLLAQRGDARRGAQLLDSYGCSACHIISGLRGAAGMQSRAGPPLTDWKNRHYIAGELVNNPLNLVRWLRDPREADPGTAMPDLDVGEEDAWSMAAYLYGAERD